jgi:hypothetical protein
MRSDIFFIKGTFGFFHQKTSPGPLIRGLMPLRIKLRIREDIRQSWLQSGVNDTAVHVHVTVVSLTPLGNQMCRTSSEMIRSTVFMRKSDSVAHGTVVSMALHVTCTVHCTVGEVDFWIFLDFQFPTVCN